MKRIGFIGTGVMGISIVRHLLKNDYPVTVYNRTKAKAVPLVKEGASWADTPLDVTIIQTSFSRWSVIHLM